MQKEQEITIAYGNEVQLTSNKETKKQVFVKFSTEFRKKQLKQLKGAPLAVFLCYALHCDENGYTWIDDVVVKKETGYSPDATREARKKLIKFGYLYQKQLYDENNRFRDYAYRIFQPIEIGKEFIIRNIKQYAKPEKSDIGKSPISGKVIGIIEEEPNNIFINKNINNKEEPFFVKPKDLTKDIPFSFYDKIELMKKDNRRNIQIIAIYWLEKGFNFKNKEQYQVSFKRDLRASKVLVGYPDEKIIEVMKFLKENSDFKWTLETVHKYIDEDLSRLKGREKIEVFDFTKD